MGAIEPHQVKFHFHESSKMIDLGKIQSNYIDLSGYSDKVTITGDYIGDRIVISGHQGKELDFVGGKIETTHIEDALCFDGEAESCKIQADNFRLVNGGMTFWATMKNCAVDGFTILFPHTGIRCTGDYSNEKVSIFRNRIVGASHEGIYFGPSNEDAKNRSTGLDIFDNVIDLSGWDGIQVGNWVGSRIYDNMIIRAGYSNRFGQNHGICINPNSQVWFWNNQLVDCHTDFIVNKATAYPVDAFQ